MPELIGESDQPFVAGVTAVNTNTSDQAGVGLLARSRAAGVHAESETWMGVFGFTRSTTGGHGVMGRAEGGGVGAVGESTIGIGLYGSTESGNTALLAEHKAGGHAGHFLGHVSITKDLNVGGDIFLQGADLAEQFTVEDVDRVEPGCVVVLKDEETLALSGRAYDRTVAGVISGAGRCRPGIILGRQPGPQRRPLALSGKVWCKVDADPFPIEFGQLLTTSSTPGHAMAATDDSRAFGSVIGKALAPLASGRGLIPIFVCLQ